MRVVRILAWMLVAAALAATPARAEVPVPGYAEEITASKLDQAIAMDFAPDGRLFFVEKKGRLRVVNTNGVVKTVLDISDHVNSEVDRGLTGVAVDAAYANNHFVYLLYTYEPTGFNTSGPKTTRLTRVVVYRDNSVANASKPETVLLGTYQPNVISEACPAPSNTTDCVPADGTSHVGGTVRAAPDGTLYVGTGDAGFAATNNPDPFRTFDPTSYAGKIMHVDRVGRGLSGHAFCPADHDLTHVCTKIFAAGFRNPFRFDFASRGGLWVGDVGENRTEELDHVVAGGSYGWPCYEGSDHFEPRSTSPTCQNRYAQEGTSAAQQNPFFTYPHPPGGGAVILGGPELDGGVYFGDIDTGFLDHLGFATDGGPGARTHIADQYRGVDMRVGPDGHLYTANFSNISRLVPVAGNRAPVAALTATPNAGPAPLTVTFDGTASSDPDGDALTYAWDLGDGALASGPVVSHTYPAGSYTAKLTVTDPAGASSSMVVLIRSGVRPPDLTVNAPATYRDGTEVVMTASARDSNGTDLSSTVHWTILLRHNDHTHSFTDQTGATARFTPLRDHDTDAHYDVTAAVTDHNNVTTSETMRLDGETAPVELSVTPTGAAGTVTYGGVPWAWPLVRQSVIGYQTIVVASDSVTSSGQSIPFAGWSDGGARSHQVTVPATGLRLTARYANDRTPPETTIQNAQSVYLTATPSFQFTASEPSTFQCRFDGGSWRSCTSPYTLPARSNGSHTFDVRATDLAGNVDATPAHADFYVIA